MKKHELTPEMMDDARAESNRYMDGELHDFYRRMKDKHGDVNPAVGMLYASLMMTVAKLVQAEARICFGGKADDQRLHEAMNRAMDAIDGYRAEIRQRASGEVN